MLKFNKIKLSNNILDGWIANNLNVCLVGKHGIGKSTIIIDAFNRHGLKYKYFSASTLDPWVDFIGIPTVKAVEDKSYIDKAKISKTKTLINKKEVQVFDSYYNS